MTVTPTPPPGFTGDPNMVSPGVIGFVAIFLLAAVTVLLAIDMTRRIRRVRYRDEAIERIAAEQEGPGDQDGAPARSDAARGTTSKGIKTPRAPEG